MKDKHTPGPWMAELREDSPTDYPGYPTRNLLIKAKTREYQIDCNCAVDLANARLMAAAPEMLDLLSECLEQLEALHYLYEGEFSERIEAADKAAVKAWKLIAKLTAE